MRVWTNETVSALGTGKPYEPVGLTETGSNTSDDCLKILAISNTLVSVLDVSCWVHVAAVCCCANMCRCRIDDYPYVCIIQYSGIKRAELDAVVYHMLDTFTLLHHQIPYYILLQLRRELSYEVVHTDWWGCIEPTASGRGHLKCDGTRAETRFRLSAKRTSPFKSAGGWGASVQSTTCSRGVRISGSNAGYTMFRGSVKGTGYPIHSPVSPSLLLP